MKAIINPFIFSQINLDSAELTMLTSVVHKIAESGSYDGTIHRGADVVGRFRLAVSDMPPEKCVSESANQVNIDLKSLDLPSADQNSATSCKGGVATSWVRSVSSCEPSGALI